MAKNFAPGSFRSPAATLDEEGVRRFCQNRISHYKIPRYIRFLEGFPSTVTGKVQKLAMREAMIEEFARSMRVSA
jgi:fatty-acyl-CoA synthase